MELEKDNWAHMIPFPNNPGANTEKGKTKKKVQDREREKGKTLWVCEGWKIKTDKSGTCRGGINKSGREEEKKGWEKTGKDRESELMSHHSTTTTRSHQNPTDPSGNSRQSALPTLTGRVICPAVSFSLVSLPYRNHRQSVGHMPSQLQPPSFL